MGDIEEFFATRFAKLVDDGIPVLLKRWIKREQDIFALFDLINDKSEFLYGCLSCDFRTREDAERARAVLVLTGDYEFSDIRIVDLKNDKFDTKQVDFCWPLYRKIAKDAKKRYGQKINEGEIETIALKIYIDMIQTQKETRG